MSTRKEKSESTRNTYTPKSRGEPRGGGMSHRVRCMDKMELFGQGTRGYTPVILASRDGGGGGE